MTPFLESDLVPFFFSLFIMHVSFPSNIKTEFSEVGAFRGNGDDAFLGYHRVETCKVGVGHISLIDTGAV